MYSYVYMYVYIYIYVNLYVYIFIYTYTHTHIYIYIYIYMCEWYMVDFTCESVYACIIHYIYNVLHLHHIALRSITLKKPNTTLNHLWGPRCRSIRSMFGPCFTAEWRNRAVPQIGLCPRCCWISQKKVQGQAESGSGFQWQDVSGWFVVNYTYVCIWIDVYM